jgi:hypothetical protein
MPSLPILGDYRLPVILKTPVTPKARAFSSGTRDLPRSYTVPIILNRYHLPSCL